MNTAKVKGKMREHEITQEEMAKRLGIALSTLNRKLQSGTDGDSFTVGEFRKMIDVLQLSDDEVISIFFDQKVS